LRCSGSVRGARKHAADYARLQPRQAPEGPAWDDGFPPTSVGPSAIGMGKTLIALLVSIFRDRVLVDAKLLGHRVDGRACGEPRSDLTTHLRGKLRAADALPLSLGACHAGLHTGADLLELELGQRRQEGQQDIADELVVRVEVGLSVRMEGNAAGVEPP
jgi:hypothetical protein